MRLCCKVSAIACRWCLAVSSTAHWCSAETSQRRKAPAYETRGAASHFSTTSRATSKPPKADSETAACSTAGADAAAKSQSGSASPSSSWTTGNSRASSKAPPPPAQTFLRPTLFAASASKRPSRAHHGAAIRACPPHSSATRCATTFAGTVTAPLKPMATAFSPIDQSPHKLAFATTHARPSRAMPSAPRTSELSTSASPPYLAILA
mmetsp:Transcript_34220/g.117902  ORF Transcript_34220/g.117902 Transcript_34220/m.117902 type:complete len:208 (+) Transcript_34220:522-1145(+)